MHVGLSSLTNFPGTGLAALNPKILECMQALGSPELVSRLARDVYTRGTVQAVFLPRGIGPTAWIGDARMKTHMRRRFMLLGQTIDGMRVWDIRRAVQAIHSLDEFQNSPLWLEAEGAMGVNVLYASLFERGITGLDLRHIPSSHMAGPDYLNVLKILDIPQAAAMAAEHCTVRLIGAEAKDWEFPLTLAKSPVAKLRFDVTE